MEKPSFRRASTILEDSSRRDWLPESDAPQNGKGLLFEFSFGQLNTAKGQKQLLSREPSDDKGRAEVRRPKTWTIKDRLALAHECRCKLLAFPELSRKKLAAQLGFTSARLNQIMELLKLTPDIQNHIRRASPSAKLLLTEEKLRKVASFTEPERQWSHLRNLDCA